MNDDELTPAERADLRARLVTGAGRIRPAGSHRGAWVAGAVAVALVAVIAGGVGVGATLSAPPITGPVSPSPTAPSPSPTPTRSATPDAPVPTVAFGGDCDAVLSANEVAAILGSPASVWDPEIFVGTTKDSAALLGGVMCSWREDGDSFGYLGVTVLDAAVVPESIISEYGSLACGGLAGDICELGRVVGDAWVGAGLSSAATDLPDSPLTEADRAREVARLQAVIDAVSARLVPGAAVATPRQPDWWVLEPCANLEASVQAAIGTPITMGFPGDSIPEGMDWETLVGAGMDDWCSWYSTTAESSTIVELYPRPGVGRPSPDALGRPTVQAVSVAGADEAWMEVDPEYPNTAYLTAVSGPNRLTVQLSSDDPARVIEVAAAVLDLLG